MMNNLCDFCEQHIKNPWGPTTYFDRRIDEIAASGADGCRTCAMFGAYVDSELSSDQKAGARARIGIEFAPYEPGDKPSDPVAIELRFELKVAREIEPLLSEGNEHVSTNTDSPASFRQAKSWLETCLKEHSGCKANAHVIFRPTRLLQIVDGNTEMPLKLVDSETLPTGIAYATLSHCWGKEVQHTSFTASVIQALEDGCVPQSLLSRTFIDAIEIAQQLGLHYIWIDSLCIIQDSHDDWLYESRQMHKVYGNATVNIAATAAHDGSSGCFRERNPGAIGPLKLKFARGEKLMMGLHIDEKLITEDEVGNKILFLSDARAWRSRFEKEPLNQRAWVVQERALARRVLHYDRDQIAWECNQLTACERYPLGLGTLIPENTRSMRQSIDAKELTEQEAEIPGLALHKTWAPVVEAYTSTNITKSTDRLIALHGVGIRLQETCGWDYIAGMFPKNNLPSQLLWRPINGCPDRPATRIAPSWSWASIINGSVAMMSQWATVRRKFPGRTPQELCERPFCKVTRCVLPTSLNTPDRHYTNHARLELSCYLLPMTFEKGNSRAISAIRGWQRRDRTQRYTGCPKFDFNLTTNRGARRPNGGRTWSSIIKGLLRDLWAGAMKLIWRRPTPHLLGRSILDPKQFSIRVQYDVWDEFWEGSDLWLMPVTNSQYATSYYFDRQLWGALEGLVLERAHMATHDGGRETLFRRCGVFRVQPKDFQSVGITMGDERHGVLDEHMRNFWAGVLEFGDVEGVKCARDSQVYHPDFDNWEKGRGTYTRKDDIPQYQIILV